MTSREPLPYVTSRRIGDVTVTIISEGELPWTPELSAPEVEWRRAIPEADVQGRFRFSLNVGLVETADRSRSWSSGSASSPGWGCSKLLTATTRSRPA